MNEKFYLRSYLLLPWADQTPNFPCTWVGTADLGYEKCDVIMCKADKASEIAEVLRADLENLKTQEQTPEIEHQQDFLKRVLSMIGVTGFDHSDSMLSGTKEALETVISKQFHRRLNDFIYLSWVAGVQ